MIITNTHKDPLGLPTGQVLAPNTPTPVSNWDEIRKNAVVSAWVRSGLLKETGNPASDQGSKFVQPDKAELQAKLDALGVHYDKRAGVAKLQALLAEAEAARKQDFLLGSDILPSDVEIAEGTTVPLGEIVQGAYAASGLSVDDWNALPPDQRDELLEAEVEKRKTEAAQG